jgi:hypothetical protein
MTRSKKRLRILHNAASVPVDHDGILDVLANLVGVLVLVGALTAILAANSAMKIKTPLARNTKKDFVMLQVGKQGVWDLQAAQDRMFRLEKDRVNGWKRCLNLSMYELIYCAESMQSWAASETVGQVRVVVSNEDTYITRKTTPTESASNLGKDGSWIRVKIKEAAAKNKALFVILEKEGFANFRMVRSIAGEHGLQLGWEPWNTGEPIHFGGGGRNMNVQ